ncbi:MAG: hypothetical protein VYE15_03780 [Myxococcota bacterium]|nr:hypothetical protein [Myxococcota bacterium]
MLWATAGARFTVIEEEAGDPEPCVVAWSDPEDEDPPGYGYSAGVLSVTGTVPEVVLTPEADGALGVGYTSNLPDEVETLLPSGGALLTVTAEGGSDIGPYTQVLQTPEPVVLVAPATGLEGLGFATASTGSPMQVSWNPGNGDSIVVSLSPIGSDFQVEAGYGLACTLAGDGGEATLPQWALEEVRDGSSKRRVALGVTRVKSRTDEVSGGSVSVGATRSYVGLLDLKP